MSGKAAHTCIYTEGSTRVMMSNVCCFRTSVHPDFTVLLCMCNAILGCTPAVNAILIYLVRHSVLFRLTWRLVYAYILRMQWRTLRHFAQPTLPAFTLRPRWRLPTPRPAFFHSPRDTVTVPSQELRIRVHWSSEAEAEGTDIMAQQELTQLQKLLGLVESKNPVKDVFFVCIDCEAWEHDQTKITEIGTFHPLHGCSQSKLTA